MINFHQYKLLFLAITSSVFILFIVPPSHQQQIQQEECVASFKGGKKLEISEGDKGSILSALTVESLEMCAEFCCEFDAEQISKSVS